MSKRKCARCGTELEEDACYWHEDYKKDICDECYRSETDSCKICGNEDLMPSDVSEFILVKCELAVTADRPPGIYRIMSRPFLSIPLIGSGSMDRNDVAFTDRLPQRDSEYDISGHICKDCARPYARTFKEVYGTPAAFSKNCNSYHSPLWPPVLTFRGNRRNHYWLDHRGSYGWWLEKCHIQSTIREHPEMLQDLECEPNDEQWDDVFKLFDLGDERIPSDKPWKREWICRYKTWHDWFALEHRGIRVYFTSEYEGLYGEERWKRLALNPAPKYRDMARNYKKDPMLIYTQELPTIPAVEASYPQRHGGRSQWHKWWDGTWEKSQLLACDLRAAVILAIERGAKGFYTNAPGSIHADGIVLA